MDIIKKRNIDLNDVLIPYGYMNTKSGVFKVMKTVLDKQITYAPCWVSALIRGGHGRSWQRLVHWVDPDGFEHRESFDMHEFLISCRTRIIRPMVNDGLCLVVGKSEALLKYLSSFCPKIIDSEKKEGEQEALLNLIIHDEAQDKRERLLHCVELHAAMDAICYEPPSA